MFEHQEIVNIEISELQTHVKKLCDEGYRLVQIGCTALDHFQIDYTFDKDHKFFDLRIKLPKEEPKLNSISTIYLPACFYENELHDLFGIQVSGMAIDFGGKFYRIAEKNPFINPKNLEEK